MRRGHMMRESFDVRTRHSNIKPESVSKSLPCTALSARPGACRRRSNRVSARRARQRKAMDLAALQQLVRALL